MARALCFSGVSVYSRGQSSGPRLYCPCRGLRPHVRLDVRPGLTARSGAGRAGAGALHQWSWARGQCVSQAGQPNPVALPPGPTCIGANYTIDPVTGACVYPATGPSTYSSPPLVLQGAPNLPITQIEASCPDGSQPDPLGECVIIPTQTAQPPSAWQTITGYLSNPWVLAGVAGVAYLATRKTPRRRH